MANENFVHELYGPTNPDGVSPKAYGWWLGGGPTIVWANLVWVLVIFGWVGFWMVGRLPRSASTEPSKLCCLDSQRSVQLLETLRTQRAGSYTGSRVMAHTVWPAGWLLLHHETWRLAACPGKRGDGASPSCRLLQLVGIQSTFDKLSPKSAVCRSAWMCLIMVEHAT